MRIAIIQMVSAASVAANLERAGALLAQADAAGAELAVLPEYFCLLGRRDTDKLDVQEAPGSGPIQDFLAAAAQRHRLWIAAGTLPIRCETAPAADGPRVFNSHEFIDALLDARREFLGESLVLVKALPLQALIGLVDQGGCRDGQRDKEQRQHQAQASEIAHARNRR